MDAEKIYETALAAFVENSKPETLITPQNVGAAVAEAIVKALQVYDSERTN